MGKYLFPLKRQSVDQSHTYTIRNSVKPFNDTMLDRTPRTIKIDTQVQKACFWHFGIAAKGLGEGVRQGEGKGGGGGVRDLNHDRQGISGGRGDRVVQLVGQLQTTLQLAISELEGLKDVDTS